jgi:hypothetical protein
MLENNMEVITNYTHFIWLNGQLHTYTPSVDGLDMRIRKGKR